MTCQQWWSCRCGTGEQSQPGGHSSVTVMAETPCLVPRAAPASPHSCGSPGCVSGSAPLPLLISWGSLLPLQARAVCLNKSGRNSSPCPGLLSHCSLGGNSPGSLYPSWRAWRAFLLPLSAVGAAVVSRAGSVHCGPAHLSSAARVCLPALFMSCLAALGVGLAQASRALGLL